jgi:hypothetical protein
MMISLRLIFSGAFCCFGYMLGNFGGDLLAFLFFVNYRDHGAGSQIRLAIWIRQTDAFLLTAAAQIPHANALILMLRIRGLLSKPAQYALVTVGLLSSSL